SISDRNGESNHRLVRWRDQGADKKHATKFPESTSDHRIAYFLIAISAILAVI
ncbi:hypothetical protein HN011_003224, partial [Eciton burchellii]